MKTIFMVALLSIVIFAGCAQPTLTESEKQAYIAKFKEEAKKPEYQLKKLDDITIIGAEWCPACQQIKQFMKENELAYTYLDCDKSEVAKEVAGTVGSIPVVIINLRDTDVKVFAGRKLSLYIIANEQLFTEYRKNGSVKKIEPQNIEQTTNHGVCTPDGVCIPKK